MTIEDHRETTMDYENSSLMKHSGTCDSFLGYQVSLTIAGKGIQY